MLVKLNAFREHCQNLAELAHSQSAAVTELIASANAELTHQSVGRGRSKPLKFTLTPFVIIASEFRRLNWLARRLHQLVERVKERSAAGHELLAAHFPRCEPQRPRHGCSYYDALIAPGGNVRFIELSPSRPVPLADQRALNAAFQGHQLGFAATARFATMELPDDDPAAASYGEDRGLFAVLTDPTFAALFSADEWAFLQRHVPWTRRATETLRDRILRERVRYVLKPAHTGDGQQVVFGSHVSDAAWAAALADATTRNYVVQEAYDQLLVPIVRGVGDGIRADELFHTVSLLMSGGVCSGILSRVAADPAGDPAADVTANGMMQPVVMLKDDGRDTMAQRVVRLPKAFPA